MKEMIKSNMNEIVHKARRRHLLKRVLALLCVVTVVSTMSVLKLDAATLERIPTCDQEEHAHDAACYGAGGVLTCTLEPHSHTDACYQGSPWKHDDSDAPDPQVDDAEDFELDAPVDELSDVQLDDVLADAPGDAPEHAAAANPVYDLNGEKAALLSDILAATWLGIGISDVDDVEESLRTDDQPLSIAIVAEGGDFRISALRDFIDADTVELSVFTKDGGIYLVDLKNGVASASDAAHEDVSAADQKDVGDAVNNDEPADTEEIKDNNTETDENADTKETGDNNTETDENADTENAEDGDTETDESSDAEESKDSKTEGDENTDTEEPEGDIAADIHECDVDAAALDVPYSLNALLALARDGEAPDLVIESDEAEAAVEPVITCDAGLFRVEAVDGDTLITPLTDFEAADITVEAGETWVFHLYHRALLEASATFPAQNFEAHVDGMAIYVNADEGAFPEGTTMAVAVIDDTATLDGIAEAVEGEGTAVRRVHAVDITFRDANGHEIEPLIPIAVSMEVEALKQTQEAVVVHMDDAGNTEVMEQSETEVETDADEAALSFVAETFSVYAVVITERYISADGQTWNIQVSYGSNAGIPEGASLEVRELEAQEYQAHLAQTAEALPDQSIASARFFDISIIHNGEKIQPAVPVEVRVTMEQGDGAVKAVHFGKTVELIDGAQREGEAVVFDAERFSVYGVIYTVDFEYVKDNKRYSYSMQEEGQVHLSEILKQLLSVDKVVMTGSTASFNDNTFDAITLTQQQSDGDWVLVNTKSFSGEHTLTVTLAAAENQLAQTIPIKITYDKIIIRDPSIELTLVDGAELIDGDWVYEAEGPSKGHAFSFQIDYSFSTDTVTKTQWDVGQIEIRIPKSVLRDRTGALKDEYLMSLALTGADGSESNEFVYKIEGDEIVIYNQLPLNPTQVGYIQLSYLTTEQTYAYGDYTSTVPGVVTESAPVKATLIIRGNNDDSLASGGTGTVTDNNFRLETDEITVHIDTTAEITSTNKRAPTKYTEWKSAWGTEPTGATGNDIYLLWSVESAITATQPFIFQLDDLTPTVTETYADGTDTQKTTYNAEVVGYRLSENNTFGTANADKRVTVDSLTTGEMIRTDYVITRHALQHADAMKEYVIQNSVEATVTPIDLVDDVTHASDTETYAEQQIKYGGAPGNISAAKWGKSTSYELSDLTSAYNTATSTNPASIGDLKFQTIVEGNTWYYTYQGNETYPNAGEYSPETQGFYGKKFVTFTIQDNSQPNTLGDNTARNNLKVWHRQSASSTEYEYTELMDTREYQIDRIDYSCIFRDATYDSTSNNFTAGANIKDREDIASYHTPTNGSSQRIGDLIFTLEKAGTEATTQTTTGDDGQQITVVAGIPLDGELHYNFATNTYTATGTDATEIQGYVDTVNSGYGVLVFNSGAKITGFTMSNSNAMYYTRLEATPSYTLIYNGDRTTPLGTALGKVGNDNPMMNLWNQAIFKVTQANTLSNYYTRSHFDKLLGDFKVSQINKSWIARQNDSVRGIYTITWNVDMNETYSIDGTTTYIPQQSGAFYDLLPLGTEYVPDSLRVYADGEELDAGLYTMSIQSNFGREGRALMTIDIKAEAEREYRFTYDTSIRWNTILELRQQTALSQGTNLKLHNAVAYVTGNDTISTYAQNKLTQISTSGSEDYKLGSMTALASGRTIATTHDCEVTAVVAGTLGLDKLVKSTDLSTRFAKTAVTYPSGEYAYRLSFGPYTGTDAKDLILYDFLENWIDTEAAANADRTPSLWHGKFKSVDTSIAKAIGAQPVVYYSTLDRETVLYTLTNIVGSDDAVTQTPFPKFGHQDIVSGSETVSSYVDLTTLKTNGDTGDTIWNVVDDTHPTSNETVTAIAVDLRRDKNDDEFVLNGGKTISITVYMEAPSTAEFAAELTNQNKGIIHNLDAPSYNATFLQASIKGRKQDTFQPTQAVYEGHTEICYRVVGDLRLKKVDETNPDVGIEGTTFRLTGTSAYGTAVNMTATSLADGWLSFRDVEMSPQTTPKAYYRLEEIASPADYVLNHTAYLVEVDEAGNAIIVGTELESATQPDNVKKIRINDDLSIAWTQGDGTEPDSGKIGWRVGNTPRAHGDMAFYKRGYLERRRATALLKGARFRLTPDPVTYYGSTEPMEAVSDAGGRVVFENIERGNYLLEEISAPDGYITLTWQFQVKCDENGVISFIDKSGVVINSDNTLTIHEPTGSQTLADCNSFLSDEKKDPDVDDATDRKYTIYNEASHDLKLYKVDAGSGKSLSGAVFALTGTNKRGDTVEMTATSDAEGVVTFPSLLVGTYYLQESTAPAHHTLDTTIYKVVVDVDGGIDISWANGGTTSKVSNYYESGSTRQFIVADNILDANKYHEACEHYYDSFNQRFVFPNERVSAEPGVITIKKIWDDAGTNTSGLPIPEVTVTTAVEIVRKYPAYISAGYWKTHVRDHFTTSGGCRYFTRYTGSDTPAPNALKGWTLIPNDDTDYKGKVYVKKDGDTLYWWADTEEIYIWPGVIGDGTDLFADTNIVKADLSAFIVRSDTTSLYHGFSGCTKLTEVVLPRFASGTDITSLEGLFNNCKALESIDFSNLDTSHVIWYVDMFFGCSSLQVLDLSSFALADNTSTGLRFGTMFKGCSSLRTVYVDSGEGKWRVKQPGNFYSGNMFAGCTSLVGQNGTKCDGGGSRNFFWAHIDGETISGYAYNGAGYFSRGYQKTSSVSDEINQDELNDLLYPDHNIQSSTSVTMTTVSTHDGEGEYDHWIINDDDGSWTYNMKVHNEYSIDADGKLRDENGEAVLDSNSVPIDVTSSSYEVVITNDGNGNYAGKLKIIGSNPVSYVQDSSGKDVCLPVYVIREETSIEVGGSSYAYLNPWAPSSYSTVNGIAYTGSAASGALLVYRNDPAVNQEVHITNAKTANQPLTGSIVIEKEVDDASGASHAGETFDFTVTVNGVDQTVSVPAGGSYTIDNIPIGANGTSWSIVENLGENPAYAASYNMSSGTLTTDAPNVIVKVTNVPTTGNLVIGKEVTLANENITADPDAEFAFIVTLKKSDGTALTGTFGGTEGVTLFEKYDVKDANNENVIDSYGKAIIVLKPGQVREINNLPAGATYTIREDYDTHYYTLTGAKKKDGENWTPLTVTDNACGGTIVSGNTDEIHFVNNKTKDEPRGGFTVTKVASTNGNSDESFHFRVELKKLKQNKTYTYNIRHTDNTRTELSFTASADGTCTIDDLYLKFGETAEFLKDVTKLADGVNFSVTELESDYIASYTMVSKEDGENGRVIHTHTPAANKVVNKALSTPTHAIEANEVEVITFTNAEPAYAFKIGKMDQTENYLAKASMQIHELNIGTATKALDSTTNSYILTETLPASGMKEAASFTSASKATTVTLTPGAYLLHEATPPEGYKAAHDIRIDVASDGTITSWSVTRSESNGTITLTEEANSRRSGSYASMEIDMVDAPYEFYVRKVVAGSGAILPGAGLEIYRVAQLPEEKDVLVVYWASGDVPLLMSGVISPNVEYRLHEKNAPNGYMAAEDIHFRLLSNGDLQTWDGTQWVTATVRLLENGDLQTWDGTQWVTTADVYEMEGDARNPLPLLTMEDETDFIFQKRWTNASGETRKYWPAGKTIEVKVKRGETVVATLTISKANDASDLSCTSDNANVKVYFDNDHSIEDAYQFHVVGLTDGVEYHFVEEQVTGYHEPLYFMPDGTSGSYITSGGVIENRSNDFEFSKLWYDQSGAIPWPADASIAIELYQRVGNSEDTLGGIYTLSASGDSDWTVLRDGQIEHAVTFSISVSGDPSEYYVREKGASAQNLPEGKLYVPSYYMMNQRSSGLVSVNQDYASDGGFIVNRPVDAYALPSTGGPGTTAFYAIGAGMVALAVALLLRKRRESE